MYLPPSIPSIPPLNSLAGSRRASVQASSSSFPLERGRAAAAAAAAATPIEWVLWHTSPTIIHAPFVVLNGGTVTHHACWPASALLCSHLLLPFPSLDNEVLLADPNGLWYIHPGLKGIHRQVPLSPLPFPSQNRHPIRIHLRSFGRQTRMRDCARVCVC